MATKKHKIAYIAMVVLIVAYFLTTLVLGVLHRQELYVSGVNVVMEDSSEVHFLEANTVKEQVMRMIPDAKTLLSEVNLIEIERELSANNYISWVNVTSNMEGKIEVKLTQRTPLCRVNTQTGYDFYVDSLDVILEPVRGYIPDVPLITGNLNFSFPRNFYGKLVEKKYKSDIENIKKLRNFVGNIGNNDYYDKFISQIYLKRGANEEIEVEILPSVGRAVALLGGLDGIEGRLERLSYFYNKAYKYAGLDTVEVVDVRFENQILVK